MGSKLQSKKSDIINTNNMVGKGKITPAQVAFLVERYLADNNFSQTRSLFRSEASSLIPSSSLHEVPKSLLSIGELLEEYIELKEQKVLIEQEKYGLAQERSRIETLLQGMQGVINNYTSAVAAVSSPPPLPLAPPSASPSIMPSSMPITSPAGYPAYRTPVMASGSMTQGVTINHTNFTTPMVCTRRKRKNYQSVPQAPKRPYYGPVTNSQLLNERFHIKVMQSDNASNCNINCHQQSPPLQSSSPTFAHGGSPLQGSNVAKNLFNKPTPSPTSNSSGPKTPPRAVSSQSDKSISPIEDVSSTAKSHNSNTPPETTPTNCTVISSKTIIVSPAKHYSIERKQCTFSSPAKTHIKEQSKRVHVKGRLDFDSSDTPTSMENISGDGSPTSESEKEGDGFDLDLPNFDAFGPDFSFTEFLTDLGIDCGDLDYSCPVTAGASTDATPESLNERNDGNFVTSQDLIEHSSAMTEVVTTDRRMNGKLVTTFIFYPIGPLIHSCNSTSAVSFLDISVNNLLLGLFHCRHRCYYVSEVCKAVH